MNMSLGKLTVAEISAQPAALSAAMEQLQLQSDWVERYLKSEQFDEVIFIGSGSSYYQALTMASTYRKWLGRSATALPSSELYLFRGQNTAANRNYLVVGVSRSGESTEVVLALESVRDLPRYTISGITCYEQSTMAQLAECLVSPLGKEESTVMTKSFSSMTFMMQAAIASASENPNLQAELGTVIEADADVVQRADAFIQRLVQEVQLHKYIYLGMGAYFGIAQEACLKIKEMSYVWTESYGTLEFRHGPKSVVEPGTLVCVLLSEQARAYELKVAQEMQEYGAYVLVVTAEAGEDTAFADGVFEVGGKQLTDEARTVLYLPALQYLGYYTALGKGVDPDSPRNLTQVVKI
ncbi:SIS domain-containing protein [Paenibacillus radicis (ex Xue et al. 2023)]|uniref:SIS domain-containing protein n=1 Tax=Paenibacillus radicis (ex Xue et al. 2023) TaxID=2972489 RepID=A0ABT1YGX3_9BACL|nr:SIS domain-containing protein [Paenibacillus radicis (ex Xue et al. 2023)]MCR8631649.1 SIS domain-containing protein [Paenibacillus radicis (ex Xue et al. 2023)]